jgi:basic membrane protein A
MKKIIALLAVLTMVFALAACAAPTATTEPAVTATQAPAAEATEAPAAEATEAPALKIGVILVGDENEGYTYAHIEGIKGAIAALGIADDQVIWKYSIPVR